jgi:hypothetical protein
METSEKRLNNAGAATPAEPTELRAIKARLKKPIVLEAKVPKQGGLTGFGSIGLELTDEEANQQYLEKGVQKLRLALKYFSIDPQDPSAWFLLSWILAKEVGWLNRASKSLEKAGRPPEWSLEDYIGLTRDIKAINAERQCGIQRACHILNKRIRNGKMARPSWMNGKKAAELKAVSLANRFSKGKKQVDNLFGLAQQGFTEM